MPAQRIGIVGGGAKAAALCAKIACLRDLFELPVAVTVFERATLGAHWGGQHGYTDGRQRLCTPAERDLGFPYDRDSFGAEVAAAMQARFSWGAFAVATGIHDDWVDRGRPRPTHGEFAAYCAHALRSSGAGIVFGEVTGLDVQRGRWRVHVTSLEDGAAATDGGFDGIVVTGPGPASGRVPMPADHRIFDGVNFWSALPAALAVARAADGPIVIIGAGGTAAATAGWLASTGLDNEILILGNQPSLFGRFDNAFENRGFRNADIWQSLSMEDRRAFTDRLTRGTVWSSVIDVLAAAPGVSYRPGAAIRVRQEPEGDATGELFVEFSTSAAPATLRSQPACLVVDATGFDAAWFTRLLPPALGALITADPAAARNGMNEALALPLAGAPPLHAPMLSQVVSPAYTSLMGLGAMADAVLRPYVLGALR